LAAVRKSGTKSRLDPQDRDGKEDRNLSLSKPERLLIIIKEEIYDRSLVPLGGVASLYFRPIDWLQG
jgi:hypothetical protein